MKTPQLSFLVLAAAAFAVAGCDSRPASPPATPAPKKSAVVLRVAVVDDDDLQRAIDRLKGEWADRSGGEIEATMLGSGADLAAACADHDVVVFPSRALGELCESHSLRPLRDRVLASDELRFVDFFPAVREVEAVYGNRVMAAPLGCPTPLVLRTADGPLAAPSDRTRLALAYLAWTAPHAVHRSRVATLFESESFAPRLTAPPFLRALDSLADATAKGGPGGKILWPERDRTIDGDPRVERPPGAEEVYNPLARAWEALGPGARQATLVASSGRLVGVTSASRNAAAAFRLVAWLAGAENGSRLSTVSDNVANCRGSGARSPDAWVNASPGLARVVAETQAEALRSQRLLVAPRLPGADAYLDALGEQVSRRLEGDASSEEALRAAAEAWSAIAQRLGADRQRQAYLRSVNAADYSPQSR